MFRKIALVAVPAAAFALIVCGITSSDSQAFARGGNYGHGVSSFHNGHNYGGYHNRYYGRYYGWGYPSYYSYQYPTYGYGVAYEPTATVVTEPAVPVYSGYSSYWGYGYGRYNHNRNFGGFRGHDRRR